MKEASALGARTARACDNCVKVRARWYCAADDAFLCHGCDNMVHSANQLASRHERVKLQSASSKVNYSVTPHHNNKVSWYSGFTRKARTPRHNNNKHLLAQQQSLHEEEEEEEGAFFNNFISLPIVPELGSEEPSLHDETEEQLLCRVPVLDVELCSMYNEVKDEVVAGEEAFDMDNFSSEFLPLDMDLAEFAADVESLLGNGADEDSSEHVKESDLLLDCKEEEDDEIDVYVNGLGAKDSMVKVKDEESPAQEEDMSKVRSNNKGIFLRLNYEDVITAWASQGSPWTTVTPPEFNSHDCWLDFLGSSGGDVQCCYGEVRSLRGLGDGEREARVSRYREKRRTRLFAKKIRYEVRKLNAEKRPRMKGRFVKRTSFVGATTALPA
ncbi:Zinc finger protein CONSTANS-LIKE 16, partial [Mucuna pruriens]